MSRRPQCDASVIPAHAAFLDQLRVEGRLEMAGPFTDQSGGAYLLRAPDHEDALAISRLDPACSSGGWDIAVREWQAR